MNIDYLSIVPLDYSGAATIGDYDAAGYDLMDMKYPHDSFTFNGRQLTLLVDTKEESAPTSLISIEDTSRSIKNMMMSESVVSWSRGTFQIKGNERCGFITNPLRSNIMITNDENLVAGTYQGITDETLLFVEFYATSFLPLKIRGNAIKRVFDTWFKSGIYGFACVVNPSLENQRLVIEGIFHDGKYAQVTLLYNNGDVNLTPKFINGEKLVPIYKEMGQTKHPVLPTRSSFVPTSIILTNRDPDEVETFVRRSLDKYPHLKGYGSTISKFKTDADWHLLIDDDIAKRKLHYFDPNDINIIKIEYTGMSGDACDHIGRLQDFWQDEICWRFKNNTIRGITIVRNDNIPLPIKFRKSSKLRYIDMLSEDGSVKPFIVNKY